MTLHNTQSPSSSYLRTTAASFSGASAPAAFSSGDTQKSPMGARMPAVSELVPKSLSMMHTPMIRCSTRVRGPSDRGEPARDERGGGCEELIHTFMTRATVRVRNPQHSFID